MQKKIVVLESVAAEELPKHEDLKLPPNIASS